MLQFPCHLTPEQQKHSDFENSLINKGGKSMGSPTLLLRCTLPVLSFSRFWCRKPPKSMKDTLVL